MCGFPRASLLIECQPGFRMQAGSEGEPVIASSDRGAHGYTPDFPGQLASFLILGPGVATGKNLGIIRMLDIAPTIAQFLGLDLETAEGRPLELQ